MSVIEGRTVHGTRIIWKLLWPDTFVGDATRARNISDLQALLAVHSTVKYIETVSKHGYRFIREVRLIDNSEKISATSSQPMIAVLPYVPSGKNGAIEMFGDGLAEDIIHALSCFSGLRVAAYGSCFQFRGPAQDLEKQQRICEPTLSFMAASEECIHVLG